MKHTRKNRRRHSKRARCSPCTCWLCSPAERKRKFLEAKAARLLKEETLFPLQG